MSHELQQKAAGLAIATQKLLEKQSAEKQAWAKSVTAAVDSLIKAGSAKEADRKHLVDSLTQTPGKTLEILQKLAAANREATTKLAQKQAQPAPALGQPDEPNKPRGTKQASVERESDKIWEETFRR